MPRPAAAAAPRHAPAPTRRRAQTTRAPARRSSGPARGRTAAQTAAAAPYAVPRRAPRTGAPSRRAARPAPLVQRIARGRIGATLDWVLRGRACVLLFGVLLAGVVFFNVSLLEKNNGIARMNQQSTAIAMQNQKLRAQLATYSSEAVQAEATKHGYYLPAAGDQRFIKRAGVKANARKAAKRIVAPGTGTGLASRPTGTGSAESQQAAGTAVAPEPLQTPQTQTPPPPTPVTPAPAGP